jgi:hypothetical protein
MKSRFCALAAVVCSVSVLISCGGGGGGGGSSGSPTATSGTTNESTQLTASVGDLTGYQLTAGNAADLSGSTTIAFGASFKTILTKLNNFFISTATAQSISACSSSGLNGTSDKQQWSLIGLSTSKTTPACVSQIQDAGKYLVLQATGITDSSGNSCDLVAIAKSSGATTCLRLSLPNRSSVGSPVFYLDPSNGQKPGQLTLNGKYFFAGFYTKSSASPQYTGFARIDFTATTPTISVPYASYGVCSSADCTRLNSQDIFWAPYYPMENGDLMFTQFNLTGSANVVPNIGIVQTYYVVSNPALTDPTQAVKALINQTVTTPTDGYSIDMTNSPIGAFVAPLYGGVTQAHYNNDAFSDPAASSTNHSFFLNVGTNAGTLNCGTNTLLIRGIVSSAGVLSLTNYGGSNLGNGLGANSLSNDVTPDSSGNLFTLLWQATSSTAYTVTKYTRPLTQGVCGTSQVVYTGASTGLTVGNISIQTIRSANTVYMQNFPYWKEAGGSCQLTLGCPLASKIILGYDLATGVVTPISLAPLNGSQYFVYGEYSASTADRLYFKINDNSTTPPSAVTAQLTPSGFQNIIKFKSGVAVPNAVINGAAP